MKFFLLRSIDQLKDRSGIASRFSSELFSHLIILFICFCILAGALILKPANPGTFPVRLCEIPLPEVCVLRITTGLPCPGCGLVRSMIAAMHGDLGKSFAYHRLGLLTLVYVFLQFLYRLGFLVLPKWRIRISHYGKFLDQGLIVLGVLFGVNWIFTLFSIFPSATMFF